MQNENNRKIQDEKAVKIVTAYMEIMEIKLVRVWTCETEQDAKDNGCDLGYKSFNADLDAICKAVTKNAHTLQDTFGREYFSYMGDYDNVIQTIYAEAKKICEQMEKTHRSNLFRAA